MEKELYGIIKSISQYGFYINEGYYYITKLIEFVKVKEEDDDDE